MQQIPTLQHVKGHKDLHTAYGNLPSEAQLNVDADAEADFFQCTYPAQRPLIPQLPSNTVQLHLNGKVICASIKQKFWEASMVPAYLAYVATGFQWDDSVSATID
jgi:hypothetical protein